MEKLSTTGETWRFCYDFDENVVSLQPVAGFAAAKNGGGPEADIGFGVCVPDCEGPSVQARRGFRL